MYSSTYSAITVSDNFVSYDLLFFCFSTGGEVPQQPFVAWWIIAVSVSATVIMVVLVVAVTVGIIVALKWSRTGLESEVSSETGLKSPTLKLKGQQQQVFVTVSVDNKVTCAHA